jgi:hypothetical protein
VMDLRSLLSQKLLLLAIKLLNHIVHVKVSNKLLMVLGLMLSGFLMDQFLLIYPKKIMSKKHGFHKVVLQLFGKE